MDYLSFWRQLVGEERVIPLLEALKLKYELRRDPIKAEQYAELIEAEKRRVHSAQL